MNKIFEQLNAMAKEEGLGYEFEISIQFGHGQSCIGISVFSPSEDAPFFISIDELESMPRSARAYLQQINK